MKRTQSFVTLILAGLLLSTAYYQTLLVFDTLNSNLQKIPSTLLKYPLIIYPEISPYPSFCNIPLPLSFGLILIPYT